MDLDFYATGTTTCTQIDIIKLFKDGFSTGHGFLREPGSIRSYAALACIAIQANQNTQHGGQSIPNFDYGMAVGINKSFRKAIIQKILDFLNINVGLSAVDLKADIKSDVDRYIRNGVNLGDYVAEGNILRDPSRIMAIVSIIRKYTNVDINHDIAHNIMKSAIHSVIDETHQAMEAVIHNLNSMHSRAGSQVPFSSLNYGTDTSDAGRLAIRETLNAIMEGLGNGETAIFPISIFRVKDGVNFKPGDPNYDLYKYSMEVTAKRLFPNYLFLDAPFNLQYYVEGKPETYVATMGCVEKDEYITYKYDGKLYVESIGRAYARLKKDFLVHKSGESQYLNTSGYVEIYDSNKGKFVNCKKFIANPVTDGEWNLIKLDNGRYLKATNDHPLPVKDKGRTFVRDLEVGDKIPVIWEQYSDETVHMDTDMAWLLGLILCDSHYDKYGAVIYLGADESDIVSKIETVCNNHGFGCKVKKQSRGKSGDYYEVAVNMTRGEHRIKLSKFFGGINKEDRAIPAKVFRWNTEAKAAFFAGMMDADGYIAKTPKDHDKRTARFNLGSTNRELALGQMALAQALGSQCKMYCNHYSSKDPSAIRYKLEFVPIESVANHMSSGKKLDNHRSYEPCNIKTPKYAAVTEIVIVSAKSNEKCYDVETASDRFDVSGINSHNCRTRVMSNINGPEISHSRGNLSFTTINLPRLAIESKGDIDLFFEKLSKMLQLVEEQLYLRYKYQSTKKVLNFPFLMGEGNWLGSDGLDIHDTVKEVLKQGTLSIGFIGLSETLVSLIGKHHGESQDARDLGLRIVKYMRQWCDDASDRRGLNYSLLQTPAESLSGRFIRIDKKRYGIIPGVTDKTYYTNSSHIYVGYEINAFDKIAIEAPYHALCNAGHIAYIEMDGDPSKNIDAIEQILAHMKNCGIGYGSINHPVDYDPVCGYTGIINDVCPRCGRREGEPVAVDKLRHLGVWKHHAADPIAYRPDPNEEADKIPNIFVYTPKKENE